MLTRKSFNHNTTMLAVYFLPSSIMDPSQANHTKFINEYSCRWLVFTQNKSNLSCLKQTGFGMEFHTASWCWVWHTSSWTSSRRTPRQEENYQGTLSSLSVLTCFLCDLGPTGHIIYKYSAINWKILMIDKSSCILYIFSDELRGGCGAARLTGVNFRAFL